MEAKCNRLEINLITEIAYAKKNIKTNKQTLKKNQLNKKE